MVILLISNLVNKKLIKTKAKTFQMLFYLIDMVLCIDMWFVLVKYLQGTCYMKELYFFPFSLMGVRKYTVRESKIFLPIHFYRTTQQVTPHLP